MRPIPLVSMTGMGQYDDTTVTLSAAKGPPAKPIAAGLEVRRGIECASHGDAEQAVPQELSGCGPFRWSA